MRIYDTNLSKFDGLALKTCLVLYMFAAASDRGELKTTASMLDQILTNMTDVTMFAKNFKTIKAKADHSRFAECLLNSLLLLAMGYKRFEAGGDGVLSKVLTLKINNERDLYRMYAKSSKEMPTMVKVDTDISFLEALCKFSVNFTLDDLVILDIGKPDFSPSR